MAPYSMDPRSRVLRDADAGMAPKDARRRFTPHECRNFVRRRLSHRYTITKAL